MTGNSNSLPIVSVIVPVYNAERTLERCLTAILESDYPDYEVLASDDGSSDRSVQIIERLGVQLVRGHNTGPAAARNRACARARGEIFFFADSDVEVAPDTIRKGVARFVDDPSLAALFGSYNPDPVEKGFFTRYKNYVHHWTHQLAHTEATTFWTGCGFVRRDVFERFGGLDERQRYLEDIEFGYRLSRAGERLQIDKTIQVMHHKRYGFWSLLHSDLFGRAIPWSRLMMRYRTVRRDLNLRVRNMLSVPLSFGILLSPLGALFAGAGWLLIAALGFLVLALLNSIFLRFVWRHEGIVFALGALLTQWVVYLISGLGVVLAALGVRSGGR